MRLYSRAELRDRGWSTTRINTELRRGVLMRVARGLYARRQTLTAEGHHHLLLQRHRDQILGLESAALLHGLPLHTIPAKVQVQQAGSGRCREQSHCSIRSGPLPEEAVVTRDGYQVTSLARTLVDLARVRSPLAALVPWEAALWQAREAGELGTLREQLRIDLQAATGRRGVRQAHWVHEFASPWSQSPKETESRLVIDQLGLPAPVQQFEVVQHGARLGFSDFAWPELGVLGEYDGKGKYLSPEHGLTPDQVMWREKRRQEAMEAAGWVFARWNQQQLTRPLELKERIENAFAIAAGRRRPGRVA